MSDDVILRDGEKHGLSETIYDGCCPNCGDKLYFDDYDPDPDGPSWGAECCEKYIRAYPSEVKIAVYEAGL